jgi:hypothetical protein
MRTLRLLPCLFLLSGCFDAHGIPSADAAVPSLGDAGDAGPPPTRCDPDVVGERLGEACFCNGPVALAGDVLYRRGVGIELYDLTDPGRPAPLGVLEELSSATGVLLVDAAERTLYSVNDTVPGVNVYDITDPRAPRLLARLEVDGWVSDGALDGTTLVMVGTDRAEQGWLHVIDVARPSSPRLLRSLALEGRPSQVALDADTAAVVLATGIGTAGLAFVHLRTDVMQTMAIEGGDFGRALAFAGQRLLLTGGDRLLTVLDHEGERWRVVGTLAHDSGSTLIPGLQVDGTRVVLGGNRLRVVDVSDPTRPRLLGDAEVPPGDIGALAGRDEFAYVSGGYGVVVVSLGCE